MRYGLLLLVVATLAGGCGEREQTQAREQKRQFQIVMESKLAQLEQRTDALAREPADTIEVARAGEIAALQQSQREFRARVAALDDSSADDVSESQWSQDRTVMESVYLDLEKRYAELSDSVRQLGGRVSPDSLGMEGR